METMNSLAKFYRLYQVDYWQYKLALLNSAIHNYESAKELIQHDFADIDDRDYTRMLRAELHFTYFQMVETLFEMVFALEKQDDLNLWYHLSFSKWRENYSRIQDIAGHKVGFLREEVELNQDVKIPLIQYIFCFRYSLNLSSAEMQRNLQVIQQALILFARDFSDRNDYNAYKHSLRLFHSSQTITIRPSGSGPEKSQVLGYAEDALTYLEKDPKGDIRQTAKAFDPERDFRMAIFCQRLISNIICTRRQYFLGAEGTFYSFQDVDLESLNQTVSTLKKISISRERRQENNS
ncbi:MAG: hypothetical protein JXA37_03605 [Chloroflexia bacterium]|nr:hypothetical protein [Chloroflexia bacterium]